MLGSTAEGVVMHARCPVMIVNRLIPKERLSFKKIIVCIDFSKSCKYAFQFAVKLAQKYNGKLFIFHMLSVSPTGKYPQIELETEMENLKQKLEKECKKISKGIEQKCDIWEGNTPYLEILKYAREKDADLIVMGSHTKEKEKRWYVGSAVEQVSSRAACPVVVVTDPKALLKFEG